MAIQNPLWQEFFLANDAQRQEQHKVDQNVHEKIHQKARSNDNDNQEKVACYNTKDVGGNFADRRTLMGLSLRICLQHAEASGNCWIVSFRAHGGANPGSWEGWSLEGDSDQQSPVVHQCPEVPCGAVLEECMQILTYSIFALPCFPQANIKYILKMLEVVLTAVGVGGHVTPVHATVEIFLACVNGSY